MPSPGRIGAVILSRARCQVLGRKVGVIHRSSDPMRQRRREPRLSVLSDPDVDRFRHPAFFYDSLRAYVDCLVPSIIDASIDATVFWSPSRDPTWLRFVRRSAPRRARSR